MDVLDILEQAKPEDASDILCLQKMAFWDHIELYKSGDLPMLTQTLPELQLEMMDKIFLKYVIYGKIVGSIRAFENEGICYISKVIVHPAFQNRGIGKQLMAAIEDRFNSVHRFELFTGSKSEGNLYLYKKLGYNIFKTEIVNEIYDLVYFEKLI